MKAFTKTIAALTAICLTLTGCGRHLGADTYSSNDTVGKVFYGTIVTARAVKVKDTDRLGGNGTGGLAGGAVGATTASAMTGGKGRVAATVGGAIVGALLGAVIEDKLSTQDGIEYVIRLDTPVTSVAPTPTVQQNNVSLSSNTIDNEIKQSVQMTQIQTQTISVVQTDSNMLPPGQRVMIVYHNDRPRVSAI